jgi:hypothetical protein
MVVKLNNIGHSEGKFEQIKLTINKQNIFYIKMLWCCIVLTNLKNKL